MDEALDVGKEKSLRRAIARVAEADARELPLARPLANPLL
jgi:hypothetical protein